MNKAGQKNTRPPPAHAVRLALRLSAFALGSAFALLLLLPPAACAQETANAAAAARARGMQAAADGIDDVAERFFLEYRDATAGQPPAFSDATVLLVKTALRRGRADLAEAALDHHDAHAAAAPAAAERDALAYWRGVVRLTQQRWADAEAIFARLTGAGTPAEYRSLALAGLGDACTRQGKWAEAEAAYARCLEEFPAAPHAGRARFGLFAATLAGGDLARAAAHLQRFESEPGALRAPAPAFYRILLLAAEEKLTEAVALFAREQGNVPPRPGDEFRLAAVRLADALTRAGRHADALPVLRRALDWTTDADARLEIRQRLLLGLLALGQTENLIAEVDAFAKERPGHPEVRTAELQLADHLRKTGSFLTASEYYGRVAEDERAPAPLRFRAAYDRAACLRDASQPTNASQAFTRAAKLAQTPEEQAECLFLAAEATGAAGNFANAAVLYQSVADTFPQSPFAERARFNQGIARAREGQPAAAASILKTFLDNHPTSPLRDEARVERGTALRAAGETVQALAELRAFADEAGTSPLAPRALFEASHAALGAGTPDDAVALLSRLIKDYPQSPLLASALYQRAHLGFIRDDSRSALADSQLFLETFPQSPLAADVLLWLGDYHVSSAAPKQGEDYYLLLATRFPASPLAPVALIEAAESAFARDDQERAAALTGQVFRDYAAALPPPQLAAAEFLQGDLLATQGNYRDALPHFQRAAQLVPGTPVGFAAAGRAGEMQLSLGENAPEALEAARAIFADIAVAEKAAPAEREKARYRLAKTLEKMGRTEDALKEHLEIVYQYPVDLGAGRVRDWFYFVRSGNDAARLLLLAERYLEAARIYERLARTRIPTAAEAAAKAREIREAHGLQD
jgi:TolA-binding protein